MKTIDEDIRTGQFKNIYLLYGSENYLKQQYRQKLQNALAAPDDTMNISRFEGSKINPATIIDLAETMPFFADYRLILIDGSGFFKNKCDELADYLPDLPPTTILIFTEEEADKRGRMYKSVVKAGRAVEFARQNEQLLTRWILGRLKKEEKKITQSVLSLFLSKTGTDMGTIDRELEKLLCYTLEKDVIEAADVEAICTTQVSNQIFEMVGAIGRREQKRALALYYDLLALKEAPLRILYLINRQFRILLDLKSMKQAGLDAKAMAATAGIPPFAVSRTLTQAGRFTKQELIQALNDGTALETDCKTGKMSDQIAVELFIVQYSGNQTVVQTG